MAEKQIRSDLFVATKTFLVEGSKWVRQGDTAVAGHPNLRGRLKSGHFVPFVPTFGEPAEEPATEPVAPPPDPAAGGGGS